jgi:homoaconitase/3-isopropylmalate dehydratase large subunit
MITDPIKTILERIEEAGKVKRPKQSEIFILSPKDISPNRMDKDLEKKSVKQLKAMAKAKGIKNYAKLRKSGLADVLGKDNGKSFAVGKKGEARVGKKPGKRLAYEKRNKSV